jgi:HPt (histidine-containing phosphotransfer) domain-containing protein
LELWAGDEDFVRGLVQSFGKSAAADLSKLEHALADQDAAGLAQLAHGLKGAASQLRAESIHTAAAQLEALALQADLDRARASLAELRMHVERYLQDSPKALQMWRPSDAAPDAVRHESHRRA